MKTISIIFICLFFTVVIILFFLGIKSQSGHAAGLVNGKLARCPDTPNCINSEYPEQQTHYTSPLKLLLKRKMSTSPINTLKDIIDEMGGMIETEENNYLAATFTSKIFRFVDDVEFRIDDETNLVHLRSASRVGRRDMGANKKRVDLIRQRYEKKLLPSR